MKYVFKSFPGTLPVPDLSSLMKFIFERSREALSTTHADTSGTEGLRSGKKLALLTTGELTTDEFADTVEAIAACCLTGMR